MDRYQILVQDLNIDQTWIPTLGKLLQTSPSVLRDLYNYKPSSVEMYKEFQFNPGLELNFYNKFGKSLNDIRDSFCIELGFQFQ